MALVLAVDVSHGLIEGGECPELKFWSLSRHCKKVVNYSKLHGFFTPSEACGSKLW